MLMIAGLFLVFSSIAYRIKRKMQGQDRLITWRVDPEKEMELFHEVLENTLPDGVHSGFARSRQSLRPAAGRPPRSPDTPAFARASQACGAPRRPPSWSSSVVVRWSSASIFGSLAPS